MTKHVRCPMCDIEVDITIRNNPHETVRCPECGAVVSKGMRKLNRLL
jgi:uncharacterized Zn finger protein